MTTYRQQLTTAAEALAYAKAHPDAVLENCDGEKIKSATILLGTDSLTESYLPYTVLKTGNTITIDGRMYREGDVFSDVQLMFIGCVVEIVPAPHGLSQWKLLHIPDEVADKPAPKEPNTLTLEELTEDSVVWLMHPITKKTCFYEASCLGDYDIIANYSSRGHKLYATEEDAQLGKDKGWS